MKIILEATDNVVVADGLRTRMWVGHTESGTPVTALIAALVIDRESTDAAAVAEFERELVKRAPPQTLHVWPPDPPPHTMS